MTHRDRLRHDDQGSATLGHRDQRWLLYLSAVVATTGVQLVAPALPTLQRALALSDSELSLVTSAYLFPSMPAAFLSGLLADRVGRRFVYASSLFLFGAAGTLVPVLGESSFPLLLALRVVQGIGFAGILPLTITIIGDMFRGTSQVRVQGHRAMVMQIGATGLPLIGGVLSSLSWQLPFFAPASGIIVALLVLWRFPPTPRRRDQPRIGITLQEVPHFLRDVALVSLQFIGFMRLV